MDCQNVNGKRSTAHEIGPQLLFSVIGLSKKEAVSFRDSLLKLLVFR